MPNTPDGWLLDPRHLRQINAVAALVEAAPYTTDVRSNWRSNLNGDCQGKAAEADKLLLYMGWPMDAMEFWACDLPDGRRHAVLQVNVADVDGNVTPMIVDCRFATPKTRMELETPVDQYGAGYTDWCKIG